MTSRHRRSQRPTRRRLGSGVLAAALGLALCPWWVSPAAANTGPALTISPGEIISSSYPALTGDDANFVANVDVNGTYETPAQCATDMSCLVVPITLKVPPAALKSQNFSLSVRLSWNTIATAPTPIGNVNAEELQGFLWQTPAKKEAVTGHPPIWDSTTNGADPGTATAYNLDTVHLQMEVIQTEGPGVVFTMQYTFSDLSNQNFGGTPFNSGNSFGSGGFGSGSGGGAGAGNTFGASGPGPVQVSSMQVGTPPPGVGSIAVAPAGTATSIVVPDIAGGTVSPDLAAAAALVVPTGLGVGGPRAVSATVIGTPAGSGGSSLGADLLGLLLLPLLVALALGLWWWRRRGGQNLVLPASG